MDKKNIVWHKQILPPLSEVVLDELSNKKVLTQFYLAGGTGLALMYGHRISRDYDFFNSVLFDEDMLIQKLQGLKNLTIISKDKHTIHLVLNGIKVSFLGYTYPLLFPQKKFQTEKGTLVEVADERDIACMKISAISSRGTRRDFVDLYIVAQQYGLSELIKLFQRKFDLTPYNNVHIFKSLTYFIDAELEPMPDMLTSHSWDSVKNFFIDRVPKLF